MVTAEFQLCSLKVPPDVGIFWLPVDSSREVVLSLVIVLQVEKGHSGPIQGLGVIRLSFQDFLTVFFHPFIVYRFHLKETGSQVVVAVCLGSMQYVFLFRCEGRALRS